MKKKTLLNSLALLALLLAPLQAAFAQESAAEVLCMVLTQKDGTVSQFALKDAPVVTYEGDALVVTCGEQSLATPLSGIATFTFEKVTPDGITQTEVGKPEAIIAFGNASFKGLKPNATVGVYSIDGKLLHSAKADANGDLSISLNAYTHGIYILCTPTQSYKIKK